MVATLIAERYPLETPPSEFHQAGKEEMVETVEYGRLIVDTGKLRLNVDERKRTDRALRAMVERQDHPKPGWRRA
jgi:hypothetical protein